MSAQANHESELLREEQWFEDLELKPAGILKCCLPEERYYYADLFSSQPKPVRNDPLTHPKPTRRSFHLQARQVDAAEPTISPEAFDTL
jgi:hypothetical protein